MEYYGITGDELLPWIRQTYLGKKVTNSRSPAGNWLDFTLKNIERGAAELEVFVRPEMTNPYGNIHGGMMGLVIDEAMGWAVASLGSMGNFTSMSLNIDFLFAISGGDTLIASSRVIREGKRIVNVDCFVHHTNGTLLARGTSNLIATHMNYSPIAK
jgi:uncharacterized protein (TIGR00369 family)